MGTCRYRVWFAPGGKAKDGVPRFPWEQGVTGWVQFDNDAIRLEGKHSMGVAGDVLTFGPIQPLLKRGMAQSLEVAIPIADIERITVHRPPRNMMTNPRGQHTHFSIRQRLDDGSTVEHAFSTGLVGKKKQTESDEAIAEMLAVVPREIVEGISPQVPADWYPDPSGMHQFRYWDGAQWTPQVADNGQQSIDPIRA